MKAQLKKAAALLCAVMLLLSAAACSGGEKPSSTPESKPGTASLASKENAASGEEGNWTGEVLSLIHI